MKKVPVVLVFCQAALLAGCAGQVAPGGGPVDTVPPQIVRTSPDTNAVRVETNLGRVDLEFSEYVDRRTVEESIFISPYVGELDFEWSGTEVAILLPQQLRKNTTYVVNVGTDVLDVRARNRMAAGYTLAFSTGDSIDHGFITGRVFDEKPEGVMIFAYALDAINPDTLNPTHAKPDYITQTGKGGAFTLANIALGRYRLLAVRDEYKNLVYDKEVDHVGVTQHDIALGANQMTAGNVWFRLSREDTTRPFVSSAKALDRYRILVRFSEPVDTLTFERAVLSIEDTSARHPAPLLLSYVDRGAPAQVLLQTVEPLDSAGVYRMHARGVFDLAGNSIDTTHASAVFDGSAVPDTLKPRFVVEGIIDSTTGYQPWLPIRVTFSKPVSQSPVADGLRLTDTTGRRFPASLHWRDPLHAVMEPSTPLASRTWYHLRIVLDSLRDLHGLAGGDSTNRLRFETLDLRATGTIDGAVRDTAAGSKGGDVFVTVSSIDLSPPVRKTVRLKTPGKFAVDQLMEGKYVLDTFRDADSSGNYTYGRVTPFVPSERFAVYPDTVKVRARWAVEGVLITYP
jgi:hypothetical protein